MNNLYTNTLPAGVAECLPWAVLQGPDSDLILSLHRYEEDAHEEASHHPIVRKIVDLREYNQ